MSYAQRLPRPTRRDILRAAGLAGFGAALGQTLRPARAAGAPRLFAFVPAIERPRAVGEILTQGLPGVAVTAFGRFADFAAALASEKPEGTLALADTLRVLGIAASLQGVAAGSPNEPYVVLAKDPTDTLASLAGKSIGVVDVVGRSELPLLVQRLLGFAQPANVRRVLKVSDLLPLLHLDLAPAVALPERFQGEFQKQSRLPLRSLRASSASLGRVALGFPSGRLDKHISLSLRQAPASVQSLLGAEAWR